MIRNSLLTLLCCSALQATARQPPADTTRLPKGVFNRVIYYLKHTHEEKKQKKLDFSVIGGPYYSPETTLGIALMTAAQYKTQPSDSTLRISTAAVYGSGSLTGFYGIGMNSTTIFPGDKFRLSGKASFSSMPDKYWGIGYVPASDKKNYTRYTLQTSKISTDFSMRIAGRLYGGIGMALSNSNVAESDSLAGHPVIPTKSIFGLGFGPFLVYDSRDFIPNAHHGIFARIGLRDYPSFLGNTAAFSSWDAVFDCYLPIWKKAILATDFYGETRRGNVPWSLMATAGGANRLRGYYEGRFRDKSMILVQTELRQKIYGRNGMVAWIAAGNVFPEFAAFKSSQTLISYGIGYRWEFKKRVNIRFDYGIGKDQSGFYFGINEVF